MKRLKGLENQPTDVLHVHRDTEGDMQRRQRSRGLLAVLHSGQVAIIVDESKKNTGDAPEVY